MRSCSTLIAFLALAGCQPAYLQDGKPNEASPYFEIPVDSKFVLRRELTVPPFQRSVFVQDGKTLAFQNVDQYSPYCAFTVHTQRATTQTIKPDTFVVTHVSRQYYYSLAMADAQVAQVMQGEDGDSWHVLATVMELQSQAQPDVVRLICAAWGLPQNRSNVTVQTVRGSLGDIVSLELGDATARRPSGGAAPRRPGY